MGIIRAAARSTGGAFRQAIAALSKGRIEISAAGGTAMQPFETIHVDTNLVACDGGGGVGGHPRVYLNLSGAASVECPYCSRLFILRGQAAGHRAEDGHGVESPGMHGPGTAGPHAHEPPAAPAKP
jgi:uncharacterized Zn-finger protein